MPEISLATDLASAWRVEITGLEEVRPIYAKTEMGSYGSVDYYVTEWKDWMGRTNQYWRMIVHGGTIQSVSDFPWLDF